MDLAATKTLALSLMQKHGLTSPVWSFKFDNAKRRFGVCRQTYSRSTKQTTKGEISLSKHLVLANSYEEVKDTILHEIAHALTPSHGHDIVWKRKCIEIGAKPEQYCSKEVATVNHLAKYIATCEGCGMVHTKFKMSERVKRAKIACSCQAGKSWDNKILLKFIDNKK